MAVCNIYVFAFFTALVAVNIIFAEENSLDQEFLDQADISADAEREARSPSEDLEQRFFFLGLPIATTCNFTTQGGLTCPSCTQALRCLPNNVGFIRNCHGFLPFCVSGRCTFFPSANCTSG